MGKQYTVAPRAEFVALQTGEYIATLTSYEETARDQDSKWGKKGDPQLLFHWEIDVPGEDPAERRTWANIPKTWAKKATFVQIAVALGLVTDEDAAANGAAVDFDQALGKRCVLSIVRKPKDGSNEWTDEIAAYSRLDRLPNRPNGRRPTPAAAPVDDDDIPF